MKVTLPGVLIALGIVFAIPFLTMIVDVWTWVMFGAGISPIEWGYLRSNGYEDSVSKPVVAIFMLIPTVVCFMLAFDIEATQKRRM